jgi:U3 small nucleolar RNA-associated protein 18
MVHLPTCSVFQNWPLNTTPLHTIETTEFSPNGKYFALGNKRGKVLMFKLNHFV